MSLATPGDNGPDLLSASAPRPLGPEWPRGPDHQDVAPTPYPGPTRVHMENLPRCLTPASFFATLVHMNQQQHNDKVPRPSSVLQGNDSMALDLLIGMHAECLDPVIADVTYGDGTMWKHSGYTPQLRTDIDGTLPNLTGCHDFRDLPVGWESSLDVVVFDPPHLPNAAASAKSGYEGIYGGYGVHVEGEGREGDGVGELFLPFMVEAKRVLVDGGIALCKIIDLVHNHRYQWQHLDLVMAAWWEGMVACDMLVVCHPSAGKLQSGRWQRVLHLRRAHCYWIVVRNGSRCERRRV